MEVDCIKKFIRALKMKSLWWLPFGVCLLRVPWPLCLCLIAERRLALVVTFNAPHGVDGALDGQLLELLHGMEWWLLLALLRLSMALSLSVFSRLTLTSRFFDMALKKRQFLHKLFGVLSGRRSASIVLLVTFVIVGFDCFQKTAYYSYKSTSRMECWVVCWVVMFLEICLYAIKRTLS